MRIFVTAKSRAKESRVEQLDQTHFIVSVKEPPIKGRANLAIAKGLARYFGVTSSAVRLVSGSSAKKKIFEIPDNF